MLKEEYNRTEEKILVKFINEIQATLQQLNTYPDLFQENFKIEGVVYYEQRNKKLYRIRRI